MQNEWIIDVLGDLRAFAADNGLASLASQIEEALVVAALEIAQDTDGDTQVGGYEREAGDAAGAAI